MPIDLELFKKETAELINGLRRGMEFGRNGQYDDAIKSLDDVIISAGLLMKKDIKIGRKLRLDKTILVAKGYQLKAYMHKMETEPEKRGQIIQKMADIARGNIDLENSYFVKINDAMGEWEETSKNGDFYTRPRE